MIVLGLKSVEDAMPCHAMPPTGLEPMSLTLLALTAQYLNEALLSFTLSISYSLKVRTHTATAIPFIYSFSGNSAASAPISTFMCL